MNDFNRGRLIINQRIVSKGTGMFGAIGIGARRPGRAVMRGRNAWAAARAPGASPEATPSPRCGGMRPRTVPDFRNQPHGTRKGWFWGGAQRNFSAAVGVGGTGFECTGGLPALRRVGV